MIIKPPIGSLCQFLDNEGKLRACRITGHGTKGTVVITYKVDNGELVEDEHISVFDLVSDEDVATHDYEVL